MQRTQFTNSLKVNMNTNIVSDRWKLKKVMRTENVATLASICNPLNCMKYNKRERLTAKDHLRPAEHH